MVERAQKVEKIRCDACPVMCYIAEGPAPFIVSREVEGVDLITVVTEAIFSYCGAKVKIDTDRHLGDETATVRVDGEAIGHVTTGEYGSQMLSLGGVHHLKLLWLMITSPALFLNIRRAR